MTEQRPLFVALLGRPDATGSSDQRQSNKIHDGVRNSLARINFRHLDGMAARLVMTLGNDFQGLFHPNAPGVKAALETMTTIPDVARPAQVSFGLGIGEIHSPLQEDAVGIQGVCFDRAQSALAAAETAKLPCALVARGSHAEKTWGLLASSLLRQQSSWTTAQRELIAFRAGYGTWKEIAKRLGVTPGAVSQRLRGAGWDFYRQSLDALTAGLLGIASELKTADS